MMDLKAIKSRILNIVESSETKRFLVFDFSQTMVEALYIESAPNAWRVRCAAIQKFNPKEGARASVQFINEFVAKNAITQKDLIISVSDANRVFIRYLVLPVLPENEILQAAKWQLKEEVPFNLDEAALDWQIIREYTDGEGVKRHGIIFVIMRSSDIEQYLEIFRQCDLNPISITSGFFNYAHILKFYSQEPQIVAVLNIDCLNSTLGIYVNQKLHFVRTLPFSSEKMIQALTGNVISQQGEVRLSNQEAQDLIASVGVPWNIQDLKTKIPPSQILSMMRPILETLIRELKFSFDYFISKFEMERPSVIYLTGSQSNIKNIDSHIHKEFDIAVQYLSLPKNIVFPEAAQIEKTSGAFINALASALRGPWVINLLPRELKTKKMEAIQWILLRISTITLAGILAVMFWITHFQKEDYEKRLYIDNIHLASIVPLKDFKEKLALKEGLREHIQDNHVPLDGLLKVLSTAVPANIILSELTFDQSAFRMALKGTVIFGPNKVEQELVSFMDKLEASSYVMEADLVLSQNRESVHDFVIQCELFHQEKNERFK